MRLLNTETLALEFFPGRGKPKYAILSHTWGHEEVLFTDVQNSPASEWGRTASGQKVKRSAELAYSNGYQYIWIDSCCIDKSSSAELSEAINSMYHWYKRSSVCYAYLSDVIAKDWPVLGNNARWFSRGWTLQELIAPPSVQFYDRSWKFIGSRESLASDIAGITSIDVELLRDKHSRSASDLDRYSVSQRMAWAAYRQTTRPEDEAYCLMGIFDVNMPLLYGEGSQAFQRLQEEILKRTHDQSILLYHHDFSSVETLADWPLSAADALTVSPDHSRGVPILAPAPHHFRGVPLVKRRLPDPGPSAIQLTPDGLVVHLYLYPVRHYDSLRLGLLDCFANVDNTWVSRPAILISLEDGCYHLRRRLYIVQPDQEDVASRVLTLGLSGHQKLHLNLDELVHKTILLHPQAPVLGDLRGHKIGPTLRLRPIAQTPETVYRFGPSIPKRSSALVNIENILESAWSASTTAIIAIAAESQGTVTYPLLLHFRRSYYIEFILIRNLYNFPAEVEITPEMFQEAACQDQKRAVGSIKPDEPTVVAMELPNGDICTARITEGQWLERELLDLKITIKSRGLETKTRNVEKDSRSVQSESQASRVLRWLKTRKTRTA
ncbi:heterokaryon incompatibility protein-domain-containing protein [Truncatella angustata]|uniref:Heterokaryon incompatibility protein-domain-containing protein n=1 Tax=Truncatella angustata TaxID=152316 RepID=A0A9P8UUG8_9PEZI|nr:heterokaryon incompatibility protein-domain-containing protein [Truncatella angustata]KAH6658230.1 heterokaryon incompatibility protein-domain-containing protein [Truncatella angustata]